MAQWLKTLAALEVQSSSSSTHVTTKKKNYNHNLVTSNALFLCTNIRAAHKPSYIKYINKYF